MIHVEEPVNKYIPNDLDVYLLNFDTKKEKIEAVIEALKQSDINGCITGSVLLPDFDPDTWGTIPDIDVFVYSENDLLLAVRDMQHRGFEFGKGTDKTKHQEEWKFNRLRNNRCDFKIGINTITLYCHDVMINFTYKLVRKAGKLYPLYNAPSVLMSFDMSMVMQAYDIPSHTVFDLRPDDVDVKTAVPNPLRKVDYTTWNVDKWIRQFDRVVKYYSRGYDTRPMAKFYIDMIDECLILGNIFSSDKSQVLFDQYAEEFIEKRTQIAEWYKEHKED